MPKKCQNFGIFFGNCGYQPFLVWYGFGIKYQFRYFGCEPYFIPFIELCMLVTRSSSVPDCEEFQERFS